MLDADWADLRDRMLLEPGVANLNSGSFGPLSRVAFERVTELRRLLAAEPMDFFVRRMGPLLWQARERLAEFLHGDATRLVFATNVTSAVNLVASSLSLPAPAKWMELLLQDGKLPGEGWFPNTPRFVTTDTLMADVFKRVSRYETNYIGSERLADYMREDWKGLVTKYRMAEGGPRGWMFAPLADMRAAWEQRYGIWPWDQPDLKEWENKTTS